MDSFLVYNLSKERNHFTDSTNASRTFLMNLNQLNWSDALLHTFDIRKSILPSIKSSIHDFGTLNIDELSHVQIKVLIGDQQSAMFGLGLIPPELTKISFGTGIFVLLNTGEEIRSVDGTISTLILQHGNRKIYGVECALECGGSSLSLFRKLGFEEGYQQMVNNKLRMEEEPGSGVYIGPFFNGIMSPYWSLQQKQWLVGLDFSTKQRDVYKALLESFVFRLAQNFALLGNGSNKLVVDGGIAQSTYLLQLLDMLVGDVYINRHSHEGTARGVAFLSGIANGWFDFNFYQKLKS